MRSITGDFFDFNLSYAQQKRYKYKTLFSINIHSNSNSK